MSRILIKPRPNAGDFIWILYSSDGDQLLISALSFDDEREARLNISRILWELKTEVTIDVEEISDNLC